MSILVNYVMDLPDSCSKCPFKYSSYDMYCCRMICGDGCIVCVDSYIERRNPACPLVEIPTPHGRLIDADRLIVALKNSVYANAFFRDPTLTVSQIEQLIEHQPTIIEAEE